MSEMIRVSTVDLGEKPRTLIFKESVESRGEHLGVNRRE